MQHVNLLMTQTAQNPEDFPVLEKLATPLPLTVTRHSYWSPIINISTEMRKFHITV